MKKIKESLPYESSSYIVHEIQSSPLALSIPPILNDLKEATFRSLDASDT